MCSTAQQELAAYARQVTEDFEELAFLRSLAECLEIGDTLASRWQTAQSVLPFLRLAVKAEAVFLVAADPSSDDDDSGPVVGEMVGWAGRHVIDEATARTLVSDWRGAAIDQPLVRNRLDQPGATPSIPGLRELIIVPVSRHGALYGWVAALNRLGPPPVGEQGEVPWWGLSDMEFGTNEATLLVSAAAVFAACARNVDLIRQKENLLVGVVRALVSAVEARDPYTYGHSERVGLVAQRLGAQLGLAPQHCRRLYLTGLLHDIGKIGVSDQILRKTGQLNYHEREQVKRHARMGHSILQELDQLAFVLPGVLHHHERYDGKGYPAGIVGEEIPLDARIIAVADAYDAMVNDRPYRQGMADDQAESCLRLGAGQQWDEQVVEAFFKAFEEIRTIVRAYQPTVQELCESEEYLEAADTPGVPQPDLSDVVLSTLPPP
jgi:HD-GYP domain-containing protein (c-di-GMP phosphodiesterase class II)